MDQISYQNGFICGMATKGLVRSGELYQPKIWNDSDIYSYFYIDFRRAMADFSIGMWSESIIVYDSMQLTVTNTEFVSVGVYKVYANITNLQHGYTVINKKTSRLRFATGEILPPFSTHAFVEGQDKYIDGGYIYEHVNYDLKAKSTVETPDANLWTAIDVGNIQDSANYAFSVSSISETPSVVLT